jgi:hypothetical protein
MTPPRGSEAFSRNYEEPRYGGYGYGYVNGPSPQSGRFLALKTPAGLNYVDPAKIAYLQVKDKSATLRRRKPVLVFTVGAWMKNKPAKITVSYLAKGIAWAPSYRVDLTDPKSLVLQQSAVLKNELESFDGANIQLISGFPNMQFRHVTSPLSLNTNWTRFFQELGQRTGQSPAPMMQQVMSNSASPIDTSGIDISAVPEGEGVDLHYQDIGPRAMDEGDSMAVETASAKADYERIVEWIIPDTRAANGHYLSNGGESDKSNDGAWDAVRFRNPLKFPMTTGPAMFVAAGKFNGQQLSAWVNVGEETTLRVTKALSIRTQSVEHEVESARDAVNIAGQNYQKVTVEGEIRANNHRRETVNLVIRRRFSGDVLKADGEPKTSLLEEGAGYVNRRNQLTWSMPLKSGEELKLTYRYTLLVWSSN